MAIKSVLKCLKGARQRDNEGIRVPEAAGNEREWQAQVDTLYEALEKDNIPRSVIVIDAMGHLHNRLAVEPLCALLADPDASIRSHAAQALGDIGDASAIDALAGALSDSSDNIKAMAVVALGNIGDKRALPALEDLEVPPRNAQLYTARLKAIEQINIKNLRAKD